jgi:hypothetical protein
MRDQRLRHARQGETFVDETVLADDAVWADDDHRGARLPSRRPPRGSPP